MKTNRTIAITLIALTTTVAAALGGCSTANRTPVASSSPYPASAPVASSAYGVIESIQTVPASSGSSAVGTVAGGVVGGLLGNQVGSGRGRTAATVAGAVGGAMAGNEIGQSSQPQSTLYQIGIRLDDGSYQTIQQDTVADLRVGNRVHIENGRVYRY